MMSWTRHSGTLSSKMITSMRGRRFRFCRSAGNYRMIFATWPAMSALQALCSHGQGIRYAPVGAVLKGDFSFPGIYGGGISLITTEKGLQSLGLQTSGVDSAAIYLGGDPDPGTEASLEASLERIGLRRDMTLFNNLKSARDTKASLIRWGCFSRAC